MSDRKLREMEYGIHEEYTGIYTEQSGLYDRAAGSYGIGGSFLESLQKRETDSQTHKRRKFKPGEIL